MSIFSKISRKKLDKKVARYASNEKTLEIGSYGRATYSLYFTNRVGIDIKNGPGVDIVDSVYNLPFDDSSFSIVLCVVVLEHLEDPKKAILEMKRVLRPGGRIIVSVPLIFPIHDAPNDYWRFTKYGLKVLFKDWEIEEISAETNFNEAFAVLFQRVGYQTKFYMNFLMKAIIYTGAWLLSHTPNLVSHVYGNIQKNFEEPEAFTTSFFMVAKKR